MCAGALTAVTASASEIAMGAADVVVARGVEHMGHHPMGAEVDFNPRFVPERLVDSSAVTLGATASTTAFPQITKADADRLRPDGALHRMGMDCGRALSLVGD